MKSNKKVLKKTVAFYVAFALTLTSANMLNWGCKEKVYAAEQDTSVDSNIAVKSADEQQVSVSDGKLITQKKDESIQGTALARNVKLVDGKAKKNTRQIYAYLKAVGKSDSVIYGHQDDTFQKAGSSNLTCSDTSDVTGSIAGVLGIDGLALTGNEYSAKTYNSTHNTSLPQTPAGNVEAAAKITNEGISNGAIVTLSAHMPNFANIKTNSSYNSKTDPDYAKYKFAVYTPKDTTKDCASNILPGGKYNKVYKAYLDMIADYASQVNGTILFRPFHENTGSWFWWGAAYCDAETYKNVYRYTVEYLRDAKNIHNMLYEYGPSNTGSSSVTEYETRYPGDNYVDMVGVDMYDSKPTAEDAWISQFKSQLEVVNAFAKKHGKLFAVTETGISNDTASGDNQTALLKTGNGDRNWYNRVLDAVSQTDAFYFLLWANFSKKDGFYTPYVDSINSNGTLHGHEMLDNFISFYNDGRTIFAANQKKILTGGSVGSISVKPTTAKAIGYIVSPLPGKRIQKAITVTAKITNAKENTTAKIVFKTDKKNITVKAVPNGEGYYTAKITASQVKSLGQYVGTLMLYIDGKKVQSISQVYNIPKPEIDTCEVDGFENYNGVDTELTKAWTINKDNNCNISLTLNKSYKANGAYGLKFTYDETATGWAGATINKAADWSNCNALQFYMVPDGKNQKTVIQITANGTVYEAYLNTYEEYVKNGVNPVLVTIPFSDFCQRDTAGNPTGGLVKDCKSITSFGLWVNAIANSSAVSKGRVSGTLIYDSITAIKAKTNKVSIIKTSSKAYNDILNLKVSLNTSKVTLLKGKNKTLTATVTGNGDKSVTWYSTNPAIAAVNDNGEITAERTGTVKIVAKVRNGKKAICKFTVKANSDDKDIIPAPTNYVTEDEMKLAQEWTGVNKSALAAVMKKAESGKKVTIAVIGGSITQGTISNGTSDSTVSTKAAYTDTFFKWWKETFPSVEFNFVNAGIGATDSYLGVHRVQKDVLDKNPDLVLVEFSVNDWETDFYKKTYDNLIRRILLYKNNPAVMLLFMSQVNGDSSQNNDAYIGTKYELPMISYKNVIIDMMKKAIYTKEQLSGDTVHPSALGHAIAGEIIWKYLNSVYKDEDIYGKPSTFDKTAVTKDCYLDSEILDSTSIKPDSFGTFKTSNEFATFPNDWTCLEGTGDITFTISCKNLGIMYYCQTNGKGGQFDVYVDGKRVDTLNADFSGGWGNYAKTQECYTSDETAKHTITIKKADDSKENEFSVLGLLVSH